MPNETNEENWAARERLRRVEFWLWWRGWVGRGDLLEGFGISPAQASGDLQRYAEVNPGAMIYQTSRKRYEAQEGMRCVLHEPSLDEAAAVFGGGDWSGGDWSGGEVRGKRVAGMAGGGGVFERLALPLRSALADVSRKVVVALMGGRQLEVMYHSLNSGTKEWRVLRPGALAWDGRRWHLRAWCERRQGWRDFVVGRISEAKWPADGEVTVPPDEDWETWETVVLRLNPKLKGEKRESLRLDYGMDGDELRVSVRRAMKGYFLAEMFIDAEKGRELPRHFVVGGGPD